KNVVMPPITSVLTVVAFSRSLNRRSRMPASARRATLDAAIRALPTPCAHTDTPRRRWDSNPRGLVNPAQAAFKAASLHRSDTPPRGEYDDAVRTTSERSGRDRFEAVKVRSEHARDLDGAIGALI